MRDIRNYSYGLIYSKIESINLEDELKEALLLRVGEFVPWIKNEGSLGVILSIIDRLEEEVKFGNRENVGVVLETIDRFTKNLQRPKRPQMVRKRKPQRERPRRKVDYFTNDCEKIDADILLIGNGPSVMDKELGAEIDKFPIVARFNDAKLKGYEDYVGTKWDVWLTNYLFEVDYNWEYFIDKKVYMTSPRKFASRMEEISAVIPNTVELPRWALRYAKMIMGVWGSREFRPSNGATCCYYFSNIYNRVILYGFDHFEGKCHYFTDDIVRHHSPKYEREFFGEMREKAGVITFEDYLEGK